MNFEAPHYLAESTETQLHFIGDKQPTSGTLSPRCCVRFLSLSTRYHSIPIAGRPVISVRADRQFKLAFRQLPIIGYCLVVRKRESPRLSGIKGATQMQLGTIDSIWRYPVKGMRGEEIPHTYTAFDSAGSTRLAMISNAAVSTPKAAVIQRMQLMRMLKSPSMP